LKKLLIYLSCIGLICLISGCASIKNKAGYEAPYVQDNGKTNWHDVAGYFMSNYPDMTRNEKADLLVQHMVNAGQIYDVDEVTHIYKEKRIFVDGRRVWPIIMANESESTLEYIVFNPKENKDNVSSNSN
jgi:threonine aldolase